MFTIYHLLTCFALLNNIFAQDDGKGASARSTDVSVGCFSGDSLVMLTNGEQKSIGSLQTGDEIHSIEQFKIVPSEMFLMLHRETSQQATFYTFKTVSGHQISLTSLHLIPIVYSNLTIDYTPAKNVQLGDQFYVSIDNQLKPSSVTSITIEIKTGYFAPLTMTGTILVNDIYVSCFASIKNHYHGQIFMAPFRWYYQLTRLISIEEPFIINHNNDGIHWFIENIYRFVSYILPSVLQSF